MVGDRILQHATGVADYLAPRLESPLREAVIDEEIQRAALATLLVALGRGAAVDFTVLDNDLQFALIRQPDRWSIHAPVRAGLGEVGRRITAYGLVFTVDAVDPLSAAATWTKIDVSAEGRHLCQLRAVVHHDEVRGHDQVPLGAFGGGVDLPDIWIPGNQRPLDTDATVLKQVAPWVRRRYARHLANGRWREMASLKPSKYVQRLVVPLFDDGRVNPYQFGYGEDAGVPSWMFQALATIFGFEWMRRAEYERGEIGEALVRLWVNGSSTATFAVDVPSGKASAPHRLYVMASSSTEFTDQEAIAARTTAWAKGDATGLKDPTLLDQTLAGVPPDPSRAVIRQVGVLDLANGFLCFTDLAVFDAAAACFGIDARAATLGKPRAWTPPFPEAELL